MFDSDDDYVQPDFLVNPANVMPMAQQQQAQPAVAQSQGGLEMSRDTWLQTGDPVPSPQAETLVHS
jgi:hypothetical protein